MTILLLFACAGADANPPPEASITDPAQNAEFRAGEPFTAVGQVDDDDGPKSLDVTWTWDPEPEVAGNALQGDKEVTLYMSEGLPAEGTYALTLTAVDVHGASTSDTNQVTVTGGQAPILALKEPTQDGVYDYGSPLIVEVDVNARDDSMSDIELTWGGVAEGVADAPAVPPENGLVIFYIEDLGRGKNTLSVTATDPAGESDTAEVSFRLN